MSIYIETLIISLILVYIINYKNSKLSVIKILLMLIPMIICSAIRYDVGWDYIDIYSNAFYWVGEGLIKSFFTEPFFNYFIKIIYIISNANVDYFFVITTVIFFIFIALAIRDQSKNIFITILFFFMTRYYFMSFNIIRQAIASAIILYAIKYIKEKNLKKYIFWVLIASLFHLTSLIYIIMYFICSIDWKKKKNIGKLLFFVIVGGIIFYYIKFFSKYSTYFGSIFQGDSFLVHEIILSVTILIFATIAKKDIIYEKEYFNIYYKFEMVALVFALLSKFLPTADRLVWLFYIVDMLFIPLIIKNLKSNSSKVLCLLTLIILTSITMYFQIVLTDSYSIIPYNTIFNK